MRPVLAITHLRHANLGLAGEALAAAGVPVVHRNLFEDDALPEAGELAGIVSLGGQMSVTELGRYPFLAAERDLFRAALRAEVPILGLCLGAQLLALAAGGRVATMERHCIGWPQLSFADAARDDPLFHDVADLPVIKWHGDGIEPPPSATVIASTPTPGAAIFKVGACAWGSQMHLEATTEMLFDLWLADPVEQRALEGAGLDPAAFTAQSRDLLPQQIAAMRPVLERFAAYIISPGTRPSATPAAPPARPSAFAASGTSGTGRRTGRAP
jgi:GMP synthase (glutamine-hydrolysing)